MLLKYQMWPSFFANVFVYAVATAFSYSIESMELTGRRACCDAVLSAPQAGCSLEKEGAIHK